MSTTEQQHTPTRHSTTVGGSSAGRILACPASYKLSKKMPDKGSSPYAEEGTALHNFIEMCLYEGLTVEEVAGYVGQEHFGITMHHERIGTIMTALRQFDNYCADIEDLDGDIIAFVLEAEVEFPDIVGAFGTADVIISTPKRTVIWDWKFGAGVAVEARNNKQMAFYGRAAENSRPDLFWPSGEKPEDPQSWRVDFVISQPRIYTDNPSTWQHTFDELEQFRTSLVEAMDMAMNDPEPDYARGDHCRWCAANPICPMYKKAAELLGHTVETEGKGEVESLVPAHTPFTPEDLKEWLHTADIVETWAKAVRALAMNEAKAGRPPKGMKLVQKYSNTQYTETDPIKIDKALARRGLSLEERRKPWVPITPTQAAKKLKPLGKELPDDFTQRVPTDVAIVPVSDKRPAIKSLADRSAEAAALLSQEAAE